LNWTLTARYLLWHFFLLPAAIANAAANAYDDNDENNKADGKENKPSSKKWLAIDAKCHFVAFVVECLLGKPFFI